MFQKLKSLRFATWVLAGMVAVSCNQQPDQDQSTETDEKREAVEEKTPEMSVEDRELLDSARRYFEPLPDLAEAEGVNITDDKIALGKSLFYDARLSKSGLISCNSCHDMASYGVDNLPVSIGHKWQTGTRNAPTVLNAALHIDQFWDGRSPDVEDQAQKPILNPIEMSMPKEDFAVERLSSIREYVEDFREVYPNDDTAISYANIGDAIGAFERTLMTPSKFDTYLEGDATALSSKEKEGLRTFINTGCVTCHTGPALGGNLYQRFGLFGNYWEATGNENRDRGKMEATGEEGDKYIFKVPSLRNIVRTYPYFHDGSVWDLEHAIRIMARLQLNKELEDEQVDQIATFLATLTGEIPEYALKLPVLPASGKMTSKPDFY